MGSNEEMVNNRVRGEEVLRDVSSTARLTRPGAPTINGAANTLKEMEMMGGGGDEDDEDEVDEVKVGGEGGERANWNNQLDFMMSCIGYAVGLGNLWRFPYLCFKNGGGAFLIPYLIFMILCGIPLFFMEISLGQLLKAGSVRVWKMACPLFKGAGIASVIMAALCCVYYMIIISWTLLYLYHSLTDVLKWDTCNGWWNNSTLCLLPGNNKTLHLLNHSLGVNDSTYLQPPVEQFWEQYVLGISDGIHDAGHLRWDLVICHIIGWIATYLVIWKGIHSSGYVLWFTAMFPYVILIILFCFGLTLDGSGDGIIFYLDPQVHKLLSPQVWIDAGTQVFFSYGIGMGSLTALGSYNKYHHNCYRDAIVVGTVNSLTSFFGGFVIFSFLGYMAKQQEVLVKDVVKSGPGLAFLAYPDAVTTMPLPPLWSTLFFTMLLVLGLDSQFCMLEGFLTGMSDEFRSLRENPRRRKIFTAIVCVVLLLMGLPMLTQGGVFIFQLMDYYSASGMSLLFVVFFEVVALNWCFGSDKIYRGLKDMLGYYPNKYWYYSWRYISPVLVLAVFVFSFVQYQPVRYADVYVYPWYGEMLGFMIGLSSMVWIPGYAIYYLVRKAKGNTFLERLKDSIQPDCEVNFDRLGVEYEVSPPSYTQTMKTYYIPMSGVAQDEDSGGKHV